MGSRFTQIIVAAACVVILLLGARVFLGDYFSYKQSRVAKIEAICAEIKDMSEDPEANSKRLKEMADDQARAEMRRAKACLQYLKTGEINLD